MTKKQKLELTWIGKDVRPKLEPRILIEKPELSFHAEARVSDNDIFDNLLIHGDNLLALKALEQEYTGRVKCIYIDPPFNTQQAFEYYEDGIEHSLWLSLMNYRLTILHSLLAKDGTIFIHIDDNELGYLIVLLDEIFGRKNRVSVVTFKQGAATGHKSINPGVVSTANFLLIYSKNKDFWIPNKIFTARAKRDDRYSQFIVNIEDNFDRWEFTTLLKAFAASNNLPEKGLKKHFGEQYEAELAKFVFENSNSVIRRARPDYKAVGNEAKKMIDISNSNKTKIYLLKRDNNPDMYFVSGERILFYKDKLKEIDGEQIAGEPLTSIWDDILSNNLHNEGGVEFPKSKKPEGLIKRCIELSTDKHDDIVLDSFLGSGTTAAVAHKMGRRWIGIELGEHCNTHCIPRLQKVVRGADSSGITKAVNWQGGGGFRFYELGPSLIRADAWGNPVINPEFNPEMLAEALCKLENFTYSPSAATFWMHGQSSETDFIYVTTQFLTQDMLAHIAAELGEKRSLLVCCGAHNVDASAFPNITVKKIPKAVLEKCEWGKDDYSLAVENLPQAEPTQSVPASAGKSKKSVPDGQASLLDFVEGEQS